MNYKTLPIIDFDALVALVGGNKDTAKEMLALFMQELPILRQQVKEAYEQKDEASLQHHLHRLHGALCYSGALRLKAMVADFEKQVMAGTGDYDNEYAILMKEIEVVIDAYHHL